MTSIALIDDEPQLRVALGRLLRLAGYTVQSHASGEEFLQSLGAQQPDGVLLDIHMPGLSGLQVHEALRAIGLDVPVVFITASDDAEVLRSARAAGARGVLHKPFPAAVLLEAVRAALDSRRG